MIGYLKIISEYIVKAIFMLPFALSALVILERLTTKKRRKWMSILDQIEKIIQNKVKNQKGEEIIDITISNYTGKIHLVELRREYDWFFSKYKFSNNGF